MGHPSSAPARRKTLESLPRNEHGIVTKQAVRDLTKGNTSGKPGWHELLGQVGDTLTKAQKDLDKFDAAVGEDALGESLRAKAGRYAGYAEGVAARLRDIEAA